MSRLPAKRAAPRRNEGRVTHERMRPKAGARATGVEKWHGARVRACPCLVPGCRSPATLHHVTSTIHGGRITRSHRRVVPLCAKHHQKVYDPKDAAPISVEGLGHKGFYEKYGLDLLAIADRLWAETEREAAEMNEVLKASVEITAAEMAVTVARMKRDAGQ